MRNLLRYCWCGLLCMLGLSGQYVRSAEAQAEHLTLYPLLPRATASALKEGPVIDGKLDDACWKDATILSGFRPLMGGPNGAGPKTEVYVATTEQALVLGFRCHEKDLKQLVGKADAFSWTDDGLEIFLTTGNAPGEPYHHFQLNCRGALRTEYNRSERWRAPNAKAAVGQETEAYTLELRIPFADLALPEKKELLAGPWRFNVIRLRQLHPGDKKLGGAVKANVAGEHYNEESAWSPTETPSAHAPHMFGYLWLERFGGRAPAAKSEEKP